MPTVQKPKSSKLSTVAIQVDELDSELDSDNELNDTTEDIDPEQFENEIEVKRIKVVSKSVSPQTAKRKPDSGKIEHWSTAISKVNDTEDQLYKWLHEKIKYPESHVVYAECLYKPEYGDNLVLVELDMDFVYYLFVKFTNTLGINASDYADFIDQVYEYKAKSQDLVLQQKARELALAKAKSPDQVDKLFNQYLAVLKSVE